MCYRNRCLSGKSAKNMLDEKQLLTITKADDLGDVEELQLQDLGVTDDDLVPEIFNKLNAVVEINLSGNKLTCIPDGISWNNLQYLDLSRNCIKDITWLTRFPNLRDLDIADNHALTVDDSYKLMFLLKNLQFLDGKRVDDKEKIGTKFTNGLFERLQKVWDVEFKKKWKTSKDESERILLLKNFGIMSQKIKYGPNSLKGYRKWRIENIVESFTKAKLNQFDFELKDLLYGISKTVPLRDKVIEKAPRKASSFDGSIVPCKEARVSISKAHQWKFEPKMFLQCHSQEDNSDDFSTQVWCCVFEPNANDLSKSTTKVATSGGSSVCIIDCETLKVEARFEQPNEEFYTLAWTTVQLGGKSVNLLVAGGCLAFLHLLYPEQDVCYGRIKTHSSPIQNIRFVSPSSTHLLSAEKNGRIYLIDIDIPTIPEYKFKWRKLACFSGVNSAPVRLLNVNDCLFGGTEMGLYLWKDNALETDQKFTKVKSIPLGCEITFPKVDHTMIDAIEMVTEDTVATKCPQQSAIFVWKLSELCSQFDKMKTAGSSVIEVTLIAKLAWSTTNQCFINFTVCKAFNTLLVGDDVGNIWLYDVADVIKAKEAGLELCPLVSPQIIVPFPRCTRSSDTNMSKFSQKTIYNDIDCSADLKDVVVACDNNIVGIFRRVLQEN